MGNDSKYSWPIKLLNSCTSVQFLDKEESSEVDFLYLGSHPQKHQIVYDIFKWACSGIFRLAQVFQNDESAISEEWVERYEVDFGRYL